LANIDLLEHTVQQVGYFIQSCQNIAIAIVFRHSLSNVHQFITRIGAGKLLL